MEYRYKTVSFSVRWELQSLKKSKSKSDEVLQQNEQNEQNGQNKQNKQQYFCQKYIKFCGAQFYKILTERPF